MTTTVAIAPVRKSIRVNASQAHAFDVFTAGLGRWWPLDHGVGKAPRKAVVMETRLGGRWYELAEDGTETNVGKIIAWEPPQALRHVLGHQQPLETRHDCGFGGGSQIHRRRRERDAGGA